MSDRWFDEFNYEVVVHKSFLDEKLIDLYKNANPVKLEPWDPMGALAFKLK